MLEGYFRKSYQTHILEPILPLLRIHPQTLTFVGCLAGLSIPPLLYFNYTYFAFLALIVTGFLDTLDGALARHLKLTSEKGAALDITCDRIVEFAIILGLFSVNPTTRGLPCILMLGSILICVTTFLVVGIFTQNQTHKSFYYSPGIIERAEAFLFFSFMILLPDTFAAAAYLFSALTLATALIRLQQFCK